MNTVKDRYFLFCIIISFLTAAAVFGGFIIEGRGAFTVRDDFNAQQIPFTVSLHDNLLQGGLSGWDWSVDLGTSTLQAFSFYELGSIFFWLSMPFDPLCFPYVIGFIYILKYIAAAVFAYLYFRRFLRSGYIAVAVSLLYAFSGFQATDLMFYHFHDAVAFFPLLLLGLDRLMEDKNGKNLAFFAFSVFINCITNYFFFIQEAVFLVVYFLFRYFKRDLREFVKDSGICILGGCLGVAMAAVLFLPSVVYILQTPRAGESLGLGSLFYDTRGVLFILKGLLLPADTMNSHSILIHENWQSVCCYMPLVGIAPLTAYISKRRDWLSRLLILLLIVSFSPLLSAGFILFTETYLRWWYMAAAMMALAAGYVLEDAQGFLLKKHALINVALVLAFFILLTFVPYSKSENVVYNRPRFIIYTLVSLAGSAALYLMARYGAVEKRKGGRVTAIAVAAFCFFTTGMTLYFYRSDATSTSDYMSEFKRAAMLRDCGDALEDRFRIDSNNDNLVSMVGGQASLAGFISTRSNGIAEFEELFDYYSTNNGIDKGDISGLDELLGGRYELCDEKKDSSHVAEITEDGESLYIYADDDTCPIGFSVERYIRKSDLMNIERDKRAVALMQAAVVEDGFVPAGGIKMEPVLPGELNLDADNTYLCAEALKNSVSGFVRSPKGFECVSDFEDGRYIYFSVPFDGGWEAWVDGEKCDITDSGGMMLLGVPGGHHEIRFKYCTPFFREGVLISLAACLAVVFILVRDRIAGDGAKDAERKG